MPLSLRRSDWIRIAVTTGGVIVGVGLLGWHLVTVAVVEFYSPSWHAESSAAARAAGLLVATPVLVDTVVPSRDGEFVVRDVWIEENTHVTYRWMVWRQRVREGTYTLMVVARRPRDGRFDVRLAWVVRGDRAPEGAVDTMQFHGWTGTRAAEVSMADVLRPFPDSLRLVAVGRP